jgi:hypothetical protein
MIVKIGNKLYSAHNQPIMLILDDRDKANIAAMLPGANRYCAFPDWMENTKVEKFMELTAEATAFEPPPRVGSGYLDRSKSREFYIEYIDADHVRLTPVE